MHLYRRPLLWMSAFATASMFLLAPAHSDNGVCCMFEGQKDCISTLTVTLCAARAQEAGKVSDPKCGRVCAQDNMGRMRCSDRATACFTCRPGGQECEHDGDCPAGSICFATVTPNMPKRFAQQGSILLASGDPGESLAADELPQCELDLDPPLCTLGATRSGPPVEIDVYIQDIGSGLNDIDVLHADNASIPPPHFETGTNDQVTVTATKVDQMMSSRVELQVFDRAGNSTICDPILIEIVRGTGKPVSDVYGGLSQVEDTITIYNGNPGVRNIRISVNGIAFRVAGLKDDDTRTIDVSTALRPGTKNTFELTSYGAPGTSATVLIWDGGSQ
jgi:hypothetical protein